MSLKDITLGQFFPGRSPIHRLDPRSKLLAVLCYIISLFLAQWWVSYALAFALLAVSVALSAISPRAILRGMKPVLFLLVFTGLLNVLYYPGQTVLTSFWIITITLEGVLHAMFMVIRIMLLVCSTFLLTYTTSPLALTDALESLLGPLKRLRVPVHELAMMLSIALRFIPTLIEETDKIMSAQRARGADFDTGGLIRRARALLPLLVPLFVSSFRRADELATAMESRCYHGGAGRTRMNQLEYRGADWVVIYGMLLYCVLLGALGRLGL